MDLQYDIYNKIKPNRLILSNPQGNDLGVISGVKELKFKEYANSIHDISFKVFEYEDGIHNDLYDLLEEMRLIKAQDFAVFQIKEVEDIHGEDIPIAYKQIGCKSLDNELIGKYVDNIDGVFTLYDSSDQEHSILHIVAKYCTWQIGYVNQNFLNKYRTFAVDSDKIYNFLTDTVATSFGCIFRFDTWNKVINVISLDELGTITDITISDKNILKQYTKKSDLDKVITKMRVRGGSNSDGSSFSLRGVNPDGSTELTNVNYYKTTEWMSQSLIDALNTYQTAYDSYASQYAITLNTFKLYQSDLLTLQNQLADINAQISAQNQITGTSVKLHNGRPPIASESDYNTYQTAIAQINILISQKVSKETEIANKNSQILSVQSSLNNIGVALNKSNYFTSTQLKELDSFITMGDEYADETYTETDTMTKEEVIQMQLDLKANAELELSKVCRPQYTLETTVSNLWSIQDGKDSKVSYDLWKSQLKCGNLITLKLRNNYSIQVRLMSIEYDFDNQESVNLVFSDKNRLDDYLTQLSETIAQSQSSSKTFSMNYYGMLQASKSTLNLNAFRNGTFNATLNQMKNDDKGEITFDEFGIKAKQVLSDGTIGSHQMWINPWRILITDNFFESANTAIGLLTLPDGTQRMGVATDVIFGKLLMTENCYIENESGTYSFDKNGFISSAVINSNTYSVAINPSSSANIFNISVNNISKFYIDVNTNKLVVNGIINADSGTLGNLNVIGTLSGGTISGATINSIGSSFSTTIYDGKISTNMIEQLIQYSPSTFLKTTSSPGNCTYQSETISTGISSGGIVLSGDAGSFTHVGLSCMDLMVNGYKGLHVGNLVSQCVSNGLVVPNASYASSAGYVSGMQTNQITAVNTGYGNLNFLGFDNAAGVNYVQANFEPIGASDIRLKHNILSLDNIPDDLFYSLKPKQFKYKTTTYGSGIFFGLIAQEVESAFQTYGLNPYDYDLVELKDVSAYTDDGFYVDDVTHRIHYNNLISWMIKIIQNQNNRIKLLENN